MNKLKTLKELKQVDMSGPYGKSMMSDYVFYEELRQEAVKIVKLFNEGEDTTITGRFLIPLVKYEYSNSLVLAESSKYLSITKETINFIKWFFNISEDDLK